MSTLFVAHDPQAKVFFDEHGFVIIAPQFSADERSVARRALDALIDRYAHEQGIARSEYLTRISQWRDIWREDKTGTFDHWLRDTRLWSTAATFLGQPGTRLLHDHVIMKPTGASGTVPWHQDFPYWPVAPVEGLSCWCPLEDVGPDGGCLEVIDRSHEFGESPPQDFLADANEGFNARDDLVRLPAPAGSIVVLHSLTWHRTGPNLARGFRPAYISLWLPADARYAPEHSGWHPVNEHITVRPGEILNDDWFPRFGELNIRPRVDHSPHSAPSSNPSSADLSMFTASSTIAEQLRSILERAGAGRLSGGIGVLLAVDGAAHAIVRATIEAGLCTSEQTALIEKAIDNLRISADAYRLHRARNVYNGAYSEWWNVAGRAWSAHLRAQQSHSVRV